MNRDFSRERPIS